MAQTSYFITTQSVVEPPLSVNKQVTKLFTYILTNACNARSQI